MSKESLTQFVKSHPLADDIDLYYQVKTRLSQAIALGVLKSGDCLPSYNKLSQIFNVSVGTVRRAAAMLIDDDTLVAFPGKGLYVKGFAKYGFWNRFHRLCAKDGHTISIKDKLTVFERIPAEATVARELQIEVGTPVLHIIRIIWSDIHQEKSGVDEIYLRADYFEALQEKHLLEKEPTVALYALYEIVCGVIIGHATDTIDIVSVKDDPLLSLHFRKQSVMLRLTRIARLHNGLPVEYRIQRCRESEICVRIQA